MTEAVLGLPPSVRRRLADALESGLLAPPYTPVAIRSTLGGIGDQDQLICELQGWERAGISGEAAAAWITSLEEVSSRFPPASLVWTGPKARGLHSRSTRQVFEQLVRDAKESILISSYTYFDGPEAFKVLASQMDQRPSLRVTVLLNINRARFGSKSDGEVVQRFADRLWNEDWPGKERPAVHYDPRSLSSGGPKGILHAKAVIADAEKLFVTSANLTAAAMDWNIEIGVLLRDRAIAQTAMAHFQALIDQGLLRRLPEP